MLLRLRRVRFRVPRHVFRQSAPVRRLLVFRELLPAAGRGDAAVGFCRRAGSVVRVVHPRSTDSSLDTEGDKYEITAQRKIGLRVGDDEIAKQLIQKENASGAERTTLFYANSQYPDVAVKTLAIAARNESGEFIEQPVSPCGACRQVMLESQCRGGAPMRILLYGTQGIYELAKVEDLLPLCFTAEDMAVE